MLNIPESQGLPPDPTTVDEGQPSSQKNALKLWGNAVTMNINPLIHSNIVQSHYWRVDLKELHTYHEVIDAIYYNVKHMEPWERGSNVKGASTGGGVRGVGVRGIVSSAFSLMFKLFTLKLTRKQLRGLIVHPDSPYIRGVGFLFIRYAIPPEDHWSWFEEFLDDEEEIDCKAGGGEVMTIGQMLHVFLTKLDWYGTKFPRLPVPAQKKVEANLKERKAAERCQEAAVPDIIEPPASFFREQRAPVSSRERKHDKREEHGHRRDFSERSRERSHQRHTEYRSRHSDDHGRDRDRRDRHRHSDHRHRSEYVRRDQDYGERESSFSRQLKKYRRDRDRY